MIALHHSEFAGLNNRQRRFLFGAFSIFQMVRFSERQRRGAALRGWWRGRMKKPAGNWICSQARAGKGGLQKELISVRRATPLFIS